MLAATWQSRPAEMDVSIEQSRSLEQSLQAEGLYEKSSGELWRLAKPMWWRTWPHYTIEIVNNGPVTTILAPMTTLKRIRLFPIAEKRIT